MKERAIIKAIVLSLLIAATLNFAFQIYSIWHWGVEARKLYEQTGGIACRMGWSHDELARLYIEVSLIIAFAGSRIRGRLGKFTFMTGLIAVATIYSLWWREYFRLRELTGASEELTNTAYLLGGNGLNICICAVSSALLVWEGERLISSLLQRKMR